MFNDLLQALQAVAVVFSLAHELITAIVGVLDRHANGQDETKPKA